MSDTVFLKPMLLKTDKTGLDYLWAKLKSSGSASTSNGDVTWNERGAQRARKTRCSQSRLLTRRTISESRDLTKTIKRQRQLVESQGGRPWPAMI